jgi:hypothetical protein
VGLGGDLGGGTTRDTSWMRLRARLDGAVGGPGIGLTFMVSHGVASGGSPADERYGIGGVEAPFFDPALRTQQFAMPGLPALSARGARATVARVGATGGPVEPYLWIASGPGEYRVIGAERTLALHNLAFARLPGLARLHAGVAYALRAPGDGPLRAYLELTYAP